MKAEKKAAEKEAKVKETVEKKKEPNDQGAQNAYGADEETLDPNVSFLNARTLRFTHPVVGFPQTAVCVSF